MSQLFRNSSPGALTREQAVALEKKRAAARRRQRQQAEELAAQGRGGDTEIAHVTVGEIVLPKALQTQRVLDALYQAARSVGIPVDQLRVGSSANRINPHTGVAEFASSYDDKGNAVYSYTGPQIESMTVTAQPWMSGPQLTNWPTVNGGIIGGSDFGAYRPKGPHNGIDLRSRVNQPHFSVVDGEIYEIGYDDVNGDYIRVRDASGNLFSYAHTGPVDGLTKGKPVKAGDQIGFSNGSGNGSRGVDPHLHFTYRPGTPDAPATSRSPIADPRSLFDSLGGTRRAR